MKINIITPIYNTPVMYLQSYFQVLNDQMHIKEQDLEIIIINDGGQAPEINLYELSRFPLIYLNSETNVGPGAARQIGLDYVLQKSTSNTDYVVFMDSDDQFLNPQSISLYQDNYNRYYRQYHHIPDILQPNRSVWERINIQDPSVLEQEVIEVNFPDCLHGLGVSVDFLRRTEIKMLPVRYHEDIIFTAELATYNPAICKISDLIYLHRSRQGSTSYFYDTTLYQISRSVSAVHLLSKIKNGLNEDSHDYNVLEVILAHRITLPYQEGELDASNDNIRICYSISCFVGNCLWKALSGMVQEELLNSAYFNCIEDDYEMMEQEWLNAKQLILQCTERDKDLPIQQYLLQSIDECWNYYNHKLDMTSMPKCTIVIPAYNPNNEAFFACLNSINDQYAAELISLIIINDGSTIWPGDSVIQETMTNINTTIVTLPVNKGVGYARQTGLQLVQTPYVLHIDADDLLFTSDAVWHLLKYVSNHCVDGVIGYEVIEQFDPDTDQLINTKVIDKSFHETNTLHGLMCNMESIRKHNISFKPVQYGEDGIFIQELCAYNCQIHTIPFRSYLHRKGYLTHRVYSPLSNINLLNDLYHYTYYSGQMPHYDFAELLYQAEIALQGIPAGQSDCGYTPILIPEYYNDEFFRWAAARYYGWLYIMNIPTYLLQQLLENAYQDPSYTFNKCPFLQTLALRRLFSKTDIYFYNPHNDSMINLQDIEAYLKNWVMRHYMKNKDTEHIPTQLIRNFPWEYKAYRNIEEAH